MRGIILALLLIPVLCRAQGPAASPNLAPDWKAAYGQANDAAKQWRDRARQLELENAQLLQELNDTRSKVIALTKESLSSGRQKIIEQEARAAALRGIDSIAFLRMEAVAMKSFPDDDEGMVRSLHQQMDAYIASTGRQ